MRKLGNGNTLGYFHFVNHRSGRSLKAVLGIATHGYGATTGWRLAFAPTTLITRNMQLFASITGLCTILFGFRFFLGATSPSVGLGFLEPSFLVGRFDRDFFGQPACLFFSALQRLLFLLELRFLAFDRLFLLSLEAFLFAGSRRNTLFFLVPDAIKLVLLFLRLFLKHIALDVGALASNLDVDSTRTPLVSGQTEFRLRFAFQSNLARRSSCCRRVVLPVGTPQVRQ